MITVVIPTANNPIDCAILLTQLQQQSILPDQIYLADNSDDGYGTEIATRYQFTTPIYVDLMPGTITKSWNQGIRFAKGDVLILNDDIMIPHNFIEVMKSALEEEAGLCVCPHNEGFPPVNGVREGYSWIKASDISYHRVDQLPYPYLPAIRGWCFGLTRKCIDTVGLFDETFQAYYGDTDYSRRLLKHPNGIVYINGLFVHHFGNSSYSKIPKMTFKNYNYQDQLAYEKKWNLPHKNLGHDSHDNGKQAK